MPQPEPVSLIFTIDQETKNKVRFQEVVPVGSKAESGKDEAWTERATEAVPKDKAVVDKLYVSKAQLKKWGNPETLRVTIQAP